MQNNNNAKAAGLQVFNFNEKESTPIRVQMINNEPWFVAKDVCEFLGHTNHKVALRALDEDEVRKVYLTDSLGRQQLTNAVCESGLYALIIRSNKHDAKKFRKWVTGEVLPSLRKTGRYEILKSRMSGGFLDLRDVPYESLLFMGGDVRMVESDGVKWYSINDVFRCIGSRTCSSQSVRRLNAKCDLARKIQLFGMAHPGWFTTLAGVRLLLSASKKVESGKELMLEFTEDKGYGSY
ncbi:MAG: Bro-N domain-containing protein [Prevotella sp.]|nr:Bro-N domain-containing protein [Prevotella sp.]MDY3853114.1 Bro-N domain-containing protein [Prevotella sp.]